MTAALRPVRPAGHRATCDCEPCASYWTAAFRFEIQVRRKEHERIEHDLLAEKSWAPPTKLLLVGDGLDENPEVAALWLDCFRRAWERQEQIGFDVKNPAAAWAAKDAAFKESVEQTQRRLDQQRAERHPTPEYESGRQRRLRRRVKRLRALERSPEPAEAARARELADELERKMEAS